MDSQNKSFLQTNFPPDWRAMDAALAEQNIDTAIADANCNLDKIRSLKKEELTFENSVRALDRATLKLDQVWNWLNHLQSVADTPALREAVNSQMQKVSEFSSSLSVDSSLYEKIKEFDQSDFSKNLSRDQQKLLSETLLDFEFEGANLSAEKKSELMKIDAELSAKTQKFSENVLDATKAFEMFIDDPSELAGLPQSAIDLAAKKAEQKGLKGYIFTLEQPSYVPFITYADSDKRREQIWRASSNLAACGEFSNLDTMRDILKLRARKADILGMKNFADYVLARRMAKSGAAAEAFVESLRARFAPAFESEYKDVENFAKELGKSDAGLVRPFDLAYISEKLRRKKYDFDDELLRPYFPLQAVLRGMFEICQTLFGVKIKKLDSHSSTWDDSVEMYQLSNLSGKVLGIFYTDFFPRQNKRSGAWMNLLAPALDGRPALGVIAANVNEPTADKPALLSHDEVQTLFHEFGHLLHFFFMDSPELGLRDVAWDFVELPSQILENWTRYKNCLDIFASHWKDNSKIPPELFAKFEKSQKFMGANQAMRQLSFAHIDLLMHIDTQKFLDGDIESIARQQLKDYTHKYSETPPTILPRFTHLFGDSIGYAAGYYSYKWAEVLDADAFTRFQKEGLLNPKTGADFVEKILRVGSAIEPQLAFKNFMGRDPSIEALVQRTLM